MKRITAGIIMVLLLLAKGAAQSDARLFPGLEGWKKPSTLNTYTSNNLWDIINGAADSYLHYDFEEMTMGDYTRDNNQYITVEIYRHQSPEDAFGIYSQERPAKAAYIKAGAQGYQEEANLNFVAGRYYVKIRCHGKSNFDIQSVRKLSQSIAALIDPDAKIPALLSLFPLEGKITNSEQYFNVSFLGYSFLKNAFTASYDVRGTRFHIFIIANPSADVSKSMLENLMQLNGKSTANLQQGIFDLTDKYNGTMKILWKGKYLCGVYDTDDVKILQDYIALLDVNLK